MNSARRIAEDDPFPEAQANGFLIGLIGEMYELMGDSGQSERLLLKYKDMLAETYADDHIAMADVYLILSVFYSKVGMYQQAIDFAGKTLVVRINQLGVFHPCTADAHFNLGLLYRLSGNITDARRELHICRGIRKEIFGLYSLEVAKVDITSAQSEKMVHQYDIAFLLFNESYQIRRRKLGKGDRDTVQSRSCMNSVRTKLGDVMYSYDELKDAIETINTVGEESLLNIADWPKITKRAEKRGYLFETEISRSLNGNPTALHALLHFFQGGGDTTLDDVPYDPIGFSITQSTHEEPDAEDAEWMTDIDPDSPRHVPDDVSDFSDLTGEGGDQSDIESPKSPRDSVNAAFELESDTPSPRNLVEDPVNDEEDAEKEEEVSPNPFGTFPGQQQPPMGMAPWMNQGPPPGMKMNLDQSNMGGGMTLSQHAAGLRSGGVGDGPVGVFSIPCVEMAVQVIPSLAFPTAISEKILHMADQKAVTVRQYTETFPQHFHAIQAIARFANTMRPRALQNASGVSSYTADELRKAMSRTVKITTLPAAAREELLKTVRGKGSITPKDVLQCASSCPHEMLELLMLVKSGGMEPPDDVPVSEDILEIDPSLASSTPYEVDPMAEEKKKSETKASTGWTVVLLPSFDGRSTNPFFYHKDHGYIPAIDQGDGKFIVDTNAARGRGINDKVVPPGLALGVGEEEKEEEEVVSRSRPTSGRGSLNMLAPGGARPDDLWMLVSPLLLAMGSFPFFYRQHKLEHGKETTAPLAAKKMGSSLPPSAKKGGPPLPPAMGKKKGGPPLPPPAPGAKGGPPPPPPMPGGKGGPPPPPPMPGGKMAPPPLPGMKRKGMGLSKPKGPRMKQIHMEAMQSTEGTIFAWDDEGDDDDDTMSVANIFADYKDEFMIQPSKKKSSKPVGAKAVMLIDGKKSQNMNIMLAQFGKRPLTDVAGDVHNLNSDNLGISAVNALLNFIPEREEIANVKSFVTKDPNAKLGKAEKYILAFADVTRLGPRLQAMATRLTFDESFEELDEDATIVLEASNEVKDSVNLRKMMRVILMLGNELNKTAGRGEMRGFRIATLMKLKQTKTNTGISALEYLVGHLLDRMPELLEVSEEFHHMTDAARKNLGVMLANFTKFKRAVENIGNMITACENDGDTTFRTQMGDFFEASSRRIQALQEKFDELNEAYRTVCEYLGENSATLGPEELFGTLHNFFESLKSTHKSIVELRERKKKAAQRDKERAERKGRSGGGLESPEKRGGGGGGGPSDDMKDELAQMMNRGNLKKVNRGVTPRGTKIPQPSRPDSGEPPPPPPTSSSSPKIDEEDEEPPPPPPKKKNRRVAKPSKLTRGSLEKAPSKRPPSADDIVGQQKMSSQVSRRSLPSDMPPIKTPTSRNNTPKATKAPKSANQRSFTTGNRSSFSESDASGDSGTRKGEKGGGSSRSRQRRVERR